MIGEKYQVLSDRLNCSSYFGLCSWASCPSRFVTLPLTRHILVYRSGRYDVYVSAVRTRANPGGISDDQCPDRYHRPAIASSAAGSTAGAVRAPLTAHLVPLGKLCRCQNLGKLISHHLALSGAQGLPFLEDGP